MSGQPPAGTDATGHRTEQFLGHLLRVGVVLSAAVVLAGAAVYLRHHGSEPVEDRSRFKAEPAEYSQPAEIIRAALEGRGRPIVQLGLLLLIATPIARVVFSALAFVIARDWLYLVFTLIVLTVLMYGLFSGSMG